MQPALVLQLPEAVLMLVDNSAPADATELYAAARKLQAKRPGQWLIRRPIPGDNITDPRTGLAIPAAP